MNKKKVLVTNLSSGMKSYCLYDFLKEAIPPFIVNIFTLEQPNSDQNFKEPCLLNLHDSHGCLITCKHSVFPQVQWHIEEFLNAHTTDNLNLILSVLMFIIFFQTSMFICNIRSPGFIHGTGRTRRLGSEGVW